MTVELQCYVCGVKEMCIDGLCYTCAMREFWSPGAAFAATFGSFKLSGLSDVTDFARELIQESVEMERAVFISAPLQNYLLSVSDEE